MAHPVQLLAHQVEHVERLISILETHPIAIDNSIAGAGKTHTTAYLAQAFGFQRLLVIAPATVESVWRMAAQTYGLHIEILSYEALRGTTQTTPKHGLLSRNGSTFGATPLLLSYIAEGTLFVFDESQKLKNTCDAYYAAKELVGQVLANPQSSRVIFLSGTMFDKEHQVVNFLRLLGIIRHRNLIQNESTEDGNPGRLLGLEEVRAFAYNLDPETTTRLMRGRSTPEHCAYKLYIEVIQHHLASSMPSPAIPVEIDCANGYYNLSPERAVTLRGLIGHLHQATRFTQETGEIGQELHWGTITYTLAAIELEKVEIFVRKAQEVLHSGPQEKVALFFNYRLPLTTAAELLATWSPLILTGEVPRKKRAELIKAFQSPNGGRLLISNLTVAALGIDLDDTDGSFPRYAFISPSYHAMNLHQVTRRFYRAKTQSVPHLRFVYGHCGRLEMSILNALSRKKDVMKAAHHRQAEEGIKFPGEYPNDDEPETELPIENEIPRLPIGRRLEPRPLPKPSAFFNRELPR